MSGRVIVLMYVTVGANRVPGKVQSDGYSVVRLGLEPVSIMASADISYGTCAFPGCLPG